MPRQVSEEERARRLGNVARMLIEWGRAALAEEAAARAAQAETRPADSVTEERSNGT